MNVQLIPATDSRWRDALTRIAHDVHHRPEFASLEASHQGGRAAALYGENQRGEVFLVPLLIRPLPERLDLPDAWQDATSPYGYPAPITTTDDPATLNTFLDHAAHVARDNGIISLFLRWHPLLSAGARQPIVNETIVNHGETVYIDLTESRDEWQRQTRSSHRRYAARLRKLGFQVSIDDWTQLAGFHEIYCQTMQRVGARDDYFYPLPYLQELRDALPGQVHIASVLSPQGELAASALFTDCGRIVQYYLGGTDEAHLHLAPTKLLFDDVRGWAKDRGDRWFHLGGGLGATRDSLFDFKAGFSRHRATFHTSRIVTDLDHFQAAVAKTQSNTPNPNDNYFPPYRRAA